jgi:hypothetical protein
MYIGLTEIKDDGTFGGSSTEVKIIVRIDLVDYICEANKGCIVKLGGGLGEMHVKESFNEIKELLCQK